MSNDNEDLFEQDLPLYNESTQQESNIEPTLKIKSKNNQVNEDNYIPIASGLTIKSRPIEEENSNSSETTQPGLKVKTATSGLSIKKTAEVVKEESSNNDYVLDSIDAQKPTNLPLSELPEEKTTNSEPNKPKNDTNSNSLDGELFSSSRINQIKSPSNSDSIKNLEENDPVPEPGEHSPQTIIIRDRPLPEKEKSHDPEDGPALPSEPPPIIQELEEYEQVLNTAAQESVFELKQEHEPINDNKNTQSELFEEIHGEEPIHQKNSPTIYEMKDDASIGSLLMSARQKASLTIKELSRRTNIREACIIALEEENRSTLPDPIYTKSYIKSLCNELSLDYPHALKLYSDLCGEEFDTQYNIAQKGPDKYASKPANSVVQKWSALVMAVIIIALISTGFVAKYFYTPLPVFKAGEEVNLNNFHQQIIIPTPRLTVPNK